MQIVICLQFLQTYCLHLHLNQSCSLYKILKLKRIIRFKLTGTIIITWDKRTYTTQPSPQVVIYLEYTLY